MTLLAERSESTDSRTRKPRSGDFRSERSDLVLSKNTFFDLELAPYREVGLISIIHPLSWNCGAMREGA